MSEELDNNTNNPMDFSSAAAIEAMKEDLERDSKSTAEFSTDVSSEPSLKSQVTLSFDEYSQMALRVFKEIDEYMSDFFNNLKQLDEKCSQIAESFKREARIIASKDKLNKQEFDALLSNILLATTVIGIGQLWITIKTQIALEKVKALLRREAETKADSLKAIKENIGVVVDCAVEQFNLSVANNPCDLKDIHEKFNAIRLALYSQRLVVFLEATYNAALRNSFQDEYSYPSMFDVNEALLDWLFNLDRQQYPHGMRACDFRATFDPIIDNIINSIKSNKLPSPEESLFVMDSGLISVATFSYNPVETIGYKEDSDPIGVDPDSLEPECRNYLLKFVQLYYTGINNPASPLSKYIKNNKALEETVAHFYHFDQTLTEFKKQMLPLNLNIFLAAILAFLLSMMNGLKWYWALLIAAISAIIMVAVSPSKAIYRRIIKKLTYVERSIRISALNNGGYSETVDLNAIQIQNKSGCLFAVIGALIGFVALPFGPFIGGFLGFILSKLLSDRDDEVEEYDYTKVKTGSPLKGYVLMAILISGILLTIISWVKDTKSISNEDNTEQIEEFIGESSSILQLTDASGNTNRILTGYIGEYPVIFYINLDGDKITGKYAYKSILNKYGDTPASYFYLAGRVLDNKIQLTSYKFKEEDDFEYITLELQNENNSISANGILKNANTGTTFPLNLSLSE